MKTRKGPMGIMPKHVHDQSRFRELGLAIARFVEAQCQIPEEWIYEYNELANTVEIFEEESK